MGEKETLGELAAIAIGFVSVGWAWLSGLGSIAVLIAAGLGSLATYVIQSRTQRRVWKREAALRKIDNVYGPLYEEISRVTKSFNDEPIIDFNYVEKWESVRKQYHYLLIDSGLRTKLIDFYSQLDEINEKRSEALDKADAQLIRNLQEASGRNLTSVESRIIASKNSKSSAIHIELRDALLNGQHPIDYVKTKYPGYDSYDTEITMLGPELRRTIENAEEKRMVDAVIQKTIKELSEDSTIVFLKEISPRIKSLGSDILGKLRRAIEEPWNV